MSLRDDGRYHCDRCGTDVHPGDVQSSAIVTDLDPDSDIPTPRRLDFCRDRDQDGTTVKGCAHRRVLTAKALANYNETRTTA